MVIFSKLRALLFLSFLFCFFSAETSQSFAQVYDFSFTSTDGSNYIINGQLYVTADQVTNVTGTFSDGINNTPITISGPLFFDGSSNPLDINNYFSSYTGGADDKGFGFNAGGDWSLFNLAGRSGPMEYYLWDGSSPFVAGTFTFYEVPEIDDIHLPKLVLLLGCLYFIRGSTWRSSKNLRSAIPR